VDLWQRMALDPAGQRLYFPVADGVRVTDLEGRALGGRVQGHALPQIHGLQGAGLRLRAVGSGQGLAAKAQGQHEESRCPHISLPGCARASMPNIRAER
jgi:hypothetical protein